MTVVPNGDCWRVTVEQWKRVTNGFDGIDPDGGMMPDFVAYAVAHTAADAAQMISVAFDSKRGPLSRVKAVEYLGPIWQDEAGAA